MENKFFNLEIFKFVFVSVLYSIGFFILYFSKLSLSYITVFQSRLVELFILKIQNLSITDFLLTYFEPFFIFLFAIIFFSCGLAFLSVNKLGDLRYFLILIFLPFGFLFNFSILFIFFCLGLYIVSVYVIPLGETYERELKKWKHFRVGSHAVSKALFILFLLVFAGSFVTYSLDNSYQKSFMNTTTSSLGNIISSEVNNIQEGDVKDDIIQKRMKEVREQYPNLTEEQYSEIEKKLRNSINSTFSTEDINMSGVVEANIENSLIVESLYTWFPIFMSFGIWVVLEFLRSILFAPISGIFSYIFFKVGKFNRESTENP